MAILSPEGANGRRYGYYLSGFFTEYKSNVFETASDSTGQPLTIARSRGPVPCSHTVPGEALL